jgi:diadenosine tetraphosphate (Ap4A) HIT family hydrolase
MFLRSRPPLIAGQGFIALKRHCENVAELMPDEQRLLGVTMTQTARAMMKVLRPEKVHFGLYAEGVKHIHLHVTPRTAVLPAGNIPLVWLSVWRDLLERVKLRQSISDAAVAAVGERLRGAFGEQYSTYNIPT